MKGKRIENSVRSLTNLYTVVIGVALSVAIVSVIDPQKGLQSITLTSIFLFLALITTLFPFYHGALRHLDDAYIENESDHIRDGALIFDFVLLFFHGIIFVILSLLLSKPNHFAWVLIVLFVVDVIWGIFVYFGASSQAAHGAEGKWTIINGIFIAALGAYLFCNDIFLQTIQSPEKLALIVTIACTFRSIADYIWCRSFYFPKD